MLRVNHIDVFYGDLQVLWDVSFEVKEKEILVLIGANGCLGSPPPSKPSPRCLRPPKAALNSTKFPSQDPPHTKLSSTASFTCPKEGRLFAEMSVEENLIMGSLAPPRPNSAGGKRYAACVRAFPENEGKTKTVRGHPFRGRTADARHRSGPHVASPSS